MQVAAEVPMEGEGRYVGVAESSREKRALPGAVSLSSKDGVAKAAVIQGKVAEVTSAMSAQVRKRQLTASVSETETSLEKLSQNLPRRPVPDGLLIDASAVTNKVRS